LNFCLRFQCRSFVYSICFCWFFCIIYYPGAGWAILISLHFRHVVYLPVYLSITRKDPNHSIYHTVAVLFLLVFISAFSAWLSLNASKNKIEDSLFLAANSIHVANVIPSPLKGGDTSQVIRKIDYLLDLAAQYRQLDLQCFCISPEEWNNNPQILLDSSKWSKWPRPKVRKVLFQREEEIKTKFLSELQDLIMHLENLPEHCNLALSLPEILGVEKLLSGLLRWKPEIEGSSNLGSSNFPWFLIYLNQAEANLKLIRLTL